MAGRVFLSARGARWLLLAGGLLVGLGVAGSAVAAKTCPQPAKVGTERWPGQAEWKAIQNAGLRYGTIRIKVDNVFDLAKPREKVWYTRAADFLHVHTRHWVVRQLLVIQPGQPVDARQVYEAIRRLRRQKFIRAANITPVSCTDGAVNVWVLVSDAWTLKPEIGFGRAGKANRWGFMLEDANFLGTGRTVGIGHKQELERSENVLEYLTPTLANSDWGMAAYYKDLSDGRLESLALAKPFLLDTTPWAADVSMLDQRLDLYFYHRGTRMWALPQREQQLQASWQKLWSWNGTTAIRAGVAMDYERYRYGLPIMQNAGPLPPPLPEPRVLAGVGPVLSLHQDRYADFTNIRLVGRAEDYNLGWDVSARLLYDSTALGASGNGPNVLVTASKGFEPSPGWLVLSHGSLSVRRADGLWHNEALRLAATAYDDSWRRQTLVFHADYASLLHPDPENRLYIGGFQALRGYPNFYATGSRRLRVTVADRFVTPMVWFHIFRVGFVVFNDDAIIDRHAGQGWSAWYSSVGAGLRLGNLRGATAPVLYFTLAKPLHTAAGVPRGLEWVVGDVLTF